MAAEALAVSDEEDEEKLCRYCFEGTEAGALLSPCACKGGQKWVHLTCLRRWQRMVLVSQPTHPAFYERDPRHHECGVCKTTFTCPPPTRHELMASFTGPELGALVKAGCVIGAHEVFTEELERQMFGMSAVTQHASSYAHWCGGAYLITHVSAAEANVSLTIDSSDALALAIDLAHTRAARRSEAQGAVRGGQTVRLTGLQARPELNGELGLALRYVADAGRWVVMLRDGEGKKLKPANLEPLEGGSGRVLCFWGDAQWSRTQLLGEIARGHWGLCRASVAELTAAPAERRAGLDGRLVYSPETEMTEDFMRQGARQMQREAEWQDRAGGAEGEGGEADGGND